MGVPYRQLEEEGYRLPVLEVYAKFTRPALYDDSLEVLTTLTDRPLLRIRLDYEVFRSGELLATGHTIHAFVDRQGRPVRPPPWAVARMQAAFAKIP
jgi:acyl-CoA thioester hydrolase